MLYATRIPRLRLDSRQRELAWTGRFCANKWLRLARCPSRRTEPRALPNWRQRSQPFVHAHDAILLANHGAVSYGPDLLTAFFRMELTEHLARVSLVTKVLGKESLLSDEDVDTLLAARARYGIHTAANTQAGRPVTARVE